MKLLANLLVSIFVASSAFAQGTTMRNDSASTVINSEQLGTGSLSTTDRGELWVMPSTSTTASARFAHGNTPSAFYNAVSGADITDTTSTQLKASVASTRIYVSDWGCTNTSAVASRISLLDGATVIWTAMLPAGQGFHAYFNPPLRGSASTALNVQLATTATATRCAASGYTAGN